MTLQNIFSTLGSLLFIIIVFIMLNFITGTPELLSKKDLLFIIVYCVGWFTRGWHDQ